ncbi:MAG: HAD family hydrolase, partial [Desulfuromonadaceae bacterium]|nr:HAD family hydrolase [Desulfuromonadaceae bacterium]
DCDGVLFESRQANLAYYNTIFKQCGFPLVSEDEPDKVHVCHTAATPRVFSTLLNSQQAQQALDVARGVDYRQFVPLMVPEPDLLEVLHALHGQRPLAVATNRGHGVKELLTFFGLDELFVTVVSSADVERPKPHPDMLFLAAKRLGLQPRELLFVGDSELDCQAAGEAGIPFVGYKNTFAGQPAIKGHRDLLALLA